jgi:hypothetical protein
MVNHFASLLANLDMVNSSIAFQHYTLSTSHTGQGLILSTGNPLGIEELEGVPSINKDYSVLINKDYNPIILPAELQQFYNIIFHASASKHYKQFLLYCYLRLIAATDRAADVKTYDNRISYVLDDLVDFFHTPRLLVVQNPQEPFQLLVSGNFSTSTDVKSGVNHFAVRQVGNSSNILIYSLTDHLYVKQGETASMDPVNMEIALDFIGNVSAPVTIGGTGLSITLAGDFNTFNNTANKLWFFSAEAPLKFDLLGIVSELEACQEVVSNMLGFGRDHCNISYENMWNQHFNIVYRFAGLLLAYVERVHNVWRMTLT